MKYGYYLYDEHFLSLSGKRHYRLTLIDSVYEIPKVKKSLLKYKSQKELTKNYSKQETEY